MVPWSVVKQVSLFLGMFLLGALVLGMGIFCVRFWLFLSLPSAAQHRVETLEIKPGTDALSIGKLLEIQGVITDAHQFFLWSWLRKSSHKLQAGEYAFPSSFTPVEVFDQLINGRVVEHRVTFPEGSTLRDVAKILAGSGLVSEDAFLQLATSTEFIRSLGMNVSTLEGYLFPETYLFRKSQNPGSIIKTLVHQFWVHFPEEWTNRAREAGLTVHKTIILASMVEKEAKVDYERPIIAAVFLNRLQHNMPLQCDPTTVYDLPGFTGPITPAELKRQSPYNTYLNKGLPAGPICNPGVKSISAVLYPQKVSYLYFVSQNDGTHRFSQTLDEHHQAVADYYEKRKTMRLDDGSTSSSGNSKAVH